MRTIILLFIVLLFSGKGFSQPSGHLGTLLFNLTEDDNKWKPITPEELKSKNIRFLSDDKGSSIIKYDTINKAFSFTRDGFHAKHFAIIHKNDTIYIEYPSVKHHKSAFVVSPIP